MNSLIQAWLDADKRADEAREIERQACDDAEDAAPPANLRPATPGDIVEGAILWYPEFTEGRKWNRVDEIYSPSDPWKAYCAHDGCRYGLEGAHVEVDDASGYQGCGDGRDR